VFEFPFDPKSRLIFVEAVIRGPKGNSLVRMILDTGAVYTIIAPVKLAEIGCIPPATSQQISITTASTVEYAPLVRIPNIEALGQTIKNFKVCAHSLPPNMPARGLLGMDFLSRFNLHLEFPRKILRIFQ